MPRLLGRVRHWLAGVMLCSMAAHDVMKAAPLSAQPSPTAIISRIRSTGNRPIDFHAAAFPDSVFVGQQVTYQVAVLLSEQARGRLRRNPEFLPPELRGLLAYELGTPTRVPSRGYGGALAYEAHVFQRALFGVTAGAMRVPSPQLSYSLPQSASYFSREERYVVRAESAQLVIKPLPTEGRPADFTGAVGVLRASTRFDASSVRMGDPLVLTVRIEGTGNVRLFPRPVVEVSWATVVAGNERVQVDTSGALVRGSKEFDFLLTPTRDGPVTLPVIRYPYFDPYRATYAVAETSPADVRVATGELAGSEGEEAAELLPLRAWRGREIRSLRERSPALRYGTFALVLLAPLPAVVAFAGRRRRRRNDAAGTAAAFRTPEPAPTDDSPAGNIRRIRRTTIAALATRLHVTSADLVSHGDVERVLRRRGVTRTNTQAFVALLDELARLGFGGDATSTTDVTRLEQRARQLLDAVNAEAVSHGRTRLWSRRASRAGRLLVVVVALLALLRPSRTALAQDPAPINSTAPVTCESAGQSTGIPDADAKGRATSTALDLLVGEAVAAYNARRYAAATQRLAAAVSACPRDVDLLVNWGTAAWAANDTVSAVIAWQRAARLDPLAADVQTRVALLPGGARGGLAEVPMVPVFALAAAAVIAWCVAWGLLFVAWRRVEPAGALAVTAVLLLLVAVASGGTAWWGMNALDASGLAVIRRPETLRGAPGFESATVGGVSTGDVVRMSSVQEGWFRVTLADGRDGWLPASRLAPLVVGTSTR